MTKAELVAALAGYPDDMEVRVYDFRTESYDDITGVGDDTEILCIEVGQAW